MKIENVEVTKRCIGDSVIYVPQHAEGDLTHPDTEVGIITSYNDKYVFVKFETSVSCSVACCPDTLVWLLC